MRATHLFPFYSQYTDLLMFHGDELSRPPVGHQSLVESYQTSHKEG
jgi:hypothetical protein